MTPSERQRFDRRIEHLHTLGPRATAELMLALTARVGGGAALVELLDDAARITPAAVRAAGGDRFHRPPPREVPATIMGTTA